jgi:hypothetical protein
MRYKSFFCALLAVAVVAAAAMTAPAGRLLAAAPGQDAGGDAADAADENPLMIPEGYRYDPSGRRDPFVNPVPPQVVEASRPDVPPVRPPGLPGVLLNEAELSAIVRSPDPNVSVVVINAPGDRVFVAHRGDQLFDVVIREIRNTDVIFEVKPLEGDDPLAPRTLVARALTQEND